MNAQEVEDQLASRMRNIVAAELYGRVEPVPMLAHYTSVNVLKSILRSKEFWFSRVRDLEDTSEIAEGNEIVASALTEYGPSILNSVRYSELFVGEQFEAVRSKLTADTYAFSLCEHGSDQGTDRLVMWRAYGHNGHGLCLVLRKQTLLGQKAAGKFPVHWAPIEYETSSQLSEKVRARLAHVEAAFREYPEALGAIPKRRLGLFVVSCLISLVLGHKNVAFEDEHEIRFVRSPLLQNLPPPAGAVYRDVATAQGPKNVFALPLRDYPEFPINASMTALLDHVIIGPSNQQAEMFDEVQDAARHK